jgi:hypothetical protein
METIFSSKTSIKFYKTTRRPIPKDRTVHRHRCEDLIQTKVFIQIHLTTLWGSGRDLLLNITATFARADWGIIRGTRGLNLDPPDWKPTVELKAPADHLDAGRSVGPNCGPLRSEEPVSLCMRMDNAKIHLTAWTLLTDLSSKQWFSTWGRVPLRAVDGFCTSRGWGYERNMLMLESAKEFTPRAGPSSRAVWGMNRLRSLERWVPGFESYSRHGCLPAFILCLCCPVCR